MLILALELPLGRVGICGELAGSRTLGPCASTLPEKGGKGAGDDVDHAVLPVQV